MRGAVGERGRADPWSVGWGITYIRHLDFILYALKNLEGLMQESSVSYLYFKKITL